MKITKKDRKALVATFIGLPVVVVILGAIGFGLAFVVAMLMKHFMDEVLFHNLMYNLLSDRIFAGIFVVPSMLIPCIYTVYYWCKRFIIGDISFLPKALQDDEEQDDFIQLVQNPSNEKD